VSGRVLRVGHQHGRGLVLAAATADTATRGPERSRTALGSGCTRRGPELPPGAARSGIARGPVPSRPIIPGPTHIPFGKAGPRLMPWTWSGQTPRPTGPQKYPGLVAAPLVTTGRSPREVPSICGATVGGGAARWQAATAGGRVGRRFGVEPRICAMARATYESKDHAGHTFWVAATAATPSGSTPPAAASTCGSSPWRAARSTRVSAPTVTRLSMR